METQIVILAAGKGTRMETEDLPKVLMPLKGKPVISFLLEELEKLPHIPKPIIVVGFKHALVEEAFGATYPYALQEEQLGTAHAVWAARSKVTAKNILVLYGDMPFIRASSLKKIIELHKSQNPVLSMFTTHVPNFDGMYESMSGFGRIIRNEYGSIIKITENKDASDAEKKILEVNPGIYMFSTEWLWRNISHIQNNNAQGEYYLPDMVEIAIAEQERIESIPIGPEEVFGINTKMHLEQANKL